MKVQARPTRDQRLPTVPGLGAGVDRGQVRSGQVMSECLTCTFRESCCSARLSQAQVPAFAGSSIRDRNKKRGRSKGVLAGTREYEQSDRNRWQAEGTVVIC